MKRVFLLLSVLIFNSSFSQKLKFDIFLFGNKIGQTIVERTVKNDSIISYSLRSNSQAHIFFITRKIALHYDILYKQGRLFSSYSKSTRNDEVQVTTIMWLGNKYLMKRQDGTFNINTVVDCSTVKLFFAEPCNTSRIFSERMGEFRSLKKAKEGVYEAAMQDGLTYFYRYKNGVLYELEMCKGASVFMRLVK